MSDCVYWDKCKDKDGYGMTFHNGKVVRAHRLAYCEANNLNLVEIKGLLLGIDAITRHVSIQNIF